MKNILAAARQVLADLAKLENPTIAVGVAGQVAPLVAVVLGAGITAAEIVPYELVVGLVAATVQKLVGKPATAKTGK